MPKLEAFETGLIIIFDKTWNDEKTEGKIGLERIYNTWYGASIRMKKNGPHKFSNCDRCAIL